MTDQELFTMLVQMGNNVDLSATARKTCLEAAERIETILGKGSRPNLRRLPFSWLYEFTCGHCGEALVTDEKCCERCGCPINWTGGFKEE